MVQMVLRAILWLCPALPHAQAAEYAGYIARYSEQRSIDPRLVLAEIQLETGGTWRPKLISRTNDYGLMQLHVSSSTHSRYRGKEHLLFAPKTNIYLGVKMLSFWRWYHHNRCKKRDHPWWSHYQWGSKVGSPRSGLRVARVYGQLKRRFPFPKQVAQITGATSSARAASVSVDTGTSKSLIGTRSPRRCSLFGKNQTTVPSGATVAGVLF